MKSNAGLAGAITGIGAAVSGGIQNRQATMNTVHAAAVQGHFQVANTKEQGKQTRKTSKLANKQTLKTVSNLHGLAGEGTNVRLKVNADGSHDLGYTKKMIGENSREAQESHDSNGFRTATPNHYEVAKQRALGAPRLALPAGGPRKDTFPVQGKFDTVRGEGEKPAIALGRGTTQYPSAFPNNPMDALHENAGEGKDRMNAFVDSRVGKPKSAAKRPTRNGR